MQRNGKPVASPRPVSTAFVEQAHRSIDGKRIRPSPAARVVAWLVTAPALPVIAAPPSYPCYQPAATPVVDGQVQGDPAWMGVPAATGFSVLGDGYAAAKQTTLRVCWDGQAIFIAMVCDEPDVAELKPKMKEGGAFWLVDSVEIFLQPATHRQVLQFGISAFGAKGAAEGYPDFTKVQAAARRGPDFYAVEVRVPFHVLRAQPRTGDQWRANFCRNIFTTTSGGDKFTSWAPVDSRFLEPEHFATLVFSGPAPSPAKARQLSAQLNGEYRDHLVARLKTMTRQRQEYVETLSQAVHDKRFEAKATRLVARWRQVADLVHASGLASCTELRQTIASMDALLKDSYEVKYAYLISKLFDDE